MLPVAEHVGGRSTVDFLAATAGWANLLEGGPGRRSRCSGRCSSRSVATSPAPGMPSRRRSGRVAALAALGDEDAAEVLDLARGWLADSGHALPPAIRSGVDGLPAGSGVGALSLSDPRDRLLAILERSRED